MTAVFGSAATGAPRALRNSSRNYRNVLLAALASLCWLSPVAGGAAETQSNKHRTGKEVYDFYCYQCHAYSGNAQTLAASYLAPPPRNFTATDHTQLSRQQMIIAVTEGREGTAMVSFSSVLAPQEVAAAVDYIRTTFMGKAASGLRYHTAANGWPNHQRYAAAFPFAKGELSLDTPWPRLTEDQRQGHTLFMRSCITCHDRGKPSTGESAWELRALSYPRRHYDHRTPDAVSGASPYKVHDRPPMTTQLDARQQQGATLFQDNCAFCHGADGSGRNWIGSFLEPRPRDLRSAGVVQRSEESLLEVIREGLAQTSMPAWKQLLADEEILAIIAYLKRNPAPPDP